ncbi:MAG: hypothetical protein A2020_08330 [Lentisphaerae bacterium GWF2_45_14]|nr:MAG: hypothetical protein A2020_08330 [Lentisphaerae bacterium GWF2_45_14]
MSSYPKYVILKNKLLEKIKSGVFTDGKLPPLTKLSAQYKISLITAQKAVKLLEKDGVVTCHADNRGTVIDQNKTAFLKGSFEFNPFKDINVFNERKIKIRYFNSEYTHGNKTGWDEIKNSFQRRYPWIELENIYAAELENSMKSDVIQIQGRDMGHWIRKGTIFPLDDFIDGDEPWLNELHSAGTTSCKNNGRFYGLPLAFSIPLIYLREKADAAKISELDGFEDLLKNLVKQNSGIQFSIGAWSFWSHFIGEAKNFLKKEYDRQLIRSLEILKYQNSPVATPFSEEFFKRHGGMFCAYSGTTMPFMKYLKDYHAYFMPLTPDGINIFAPLLSCINSLSQHKEEAFLFIKYASSQEAQKILSANNSCFPFHNEFLGRNLFRPEHQAIENAIPKFLDNAKLFDTSSNFLGITYENIINPSINKFIDNSISAQSAISYMRKRLRELFEVYLRIKDK